jgi:hypothetical protein
MLVVKFYLVFAADSPCRGSIETKCQRDFCFYHQPGFAPKAADRLPGTRLSMQ